MHTRCRLALSALCIFTVAGLAEPGQKGKWEEDKLESKLERKHEKELDKMETKHEKFDEKLEKKIYDKRERKLGRKSRIMRFQGMDRNGDGVITRREWRGKASSFAEHDWNGDGILSGDEVRPGAKRPDDLFSGRRFRP